MPATRIVAPRHNAAVRPAHAGQLTVAPIVQEQGRRVPQDCRRCVLGYAMIEPVDKVVLWVPGRGNGDCVQTGVVSETGRIAAGSDARVRVPTAAEPPGPDAPQSVSILATRPGGP